ncbi:MAG: reverse transcriptase domain-containing protein [Chromatiaceae bacterium]|nr:reverse transcriptase domain-containing protein [Candidatus Thioaporhodococcus sediminis]
MAHDAILGRPALHQFGATISYAAPPSTNQATLPGRFDVCVIEATVETAEPRLAALLDEFCDIFAERPATTTLGIHHIPTEENHPPIAVRPRRIPIATVEQVDKELDDMLQMGVIQPSLSPWNSPVVVVKKPDNTLRFCVDFRAINKITLRDPYGMPTIDELRDQISGATYFTNLDLTKCYWQFAVNPGDVPKTAFTAGRGHWEFLKMPFGLQNAPATCQRAMDQCLRGLRFAVVYLDDILIFSRSYEDHLEHIRAVFQRLRAANLRVNRKKSHFAARSVKFLGHLVSAQGVQVTPDKVDAIQHIPAPATKKQLERFLGLANHYAKFLPGFAHTAEPLFALKRKHARNFKWEAAHQTAFDALKKALSEAPVLLTPIPGFPYYVTTDASDVAIGAALEQVVDGQRRPVAFASRLLSERERKRPIIDREALAILWACEKFRPYLFGATFWVESDHEPLKWLYETPRVKGRLAHWQLQLAEYDGLLGVKYVRGSANGAADCLSRVTSGPSPPPDSDWLEAQECSAVDEGVTRRSPDGSLLCRGTQFLPKPLRQAAIAAAHGGPDGLHFGARRTAALIRRSADWPGLLGDVANFVRSCEVCQSTRHQAQPRQPLQAFHDPGIPGHTRCADVAGPFPQSFHGKRFLLVVVDVTSRHLFAYPMVRASSPELEAALRIHLAAAGHPSILVADNARAFTSHRFRRFCRRFQIALHHPTAYRPQSNGIVERAVRTIKEQLRAFSSQFPSQVRNWDAQVPRIVAAYNATPHAATGLAPVQAMADQALAASRLSRSAAHRAAQRARRLPSTSAPPLPVGALVYRRLRFGRVSDPAAALRPRWEGPFRVTKVRLPSTYYIADAKRATRTFVTHRDSLRPHSSPAPTTGGGHVVGSSPHVIIRHSLTSINPGMNLHAVIMYY